MVSAIIAFLAISLVIFPGIGADTAQAVEASSWGQIKAQQAQPEAAAKRPASALARLWISDVTHVHDGLVITLTDAGLKFGRARNRARMLAELALDESEFDPSSWNFFDRQITYRLMRRQIGIEIYAHCWAYRRNPQPRYRVVNISFPKPY